MSNFTGTYSNGIVLSDPSTQNPSTITSTGYVSNYHLPHEGNGITGTSAAAWTLSNQGTIKADGYGVSFAGGGAVSNSGVIGSKYVAGVDIQGRLGIVSNSGTIAATHFSAFFNADGVILGAGGTVANSGLISGMEGVDVRGSGLVTNSGTILGIRGAITADTGGSVTNGVNGLIFGAHAIDIYGGTGTVINAGTISAGRVDRNGGPGISLHSGGSIGNSGAIGGGIGLDGVRFFIDPYGFLYQDPGSGGVAIVVSGGGNISNSGTIAGGAGGNDTRGLVPGGAGGAGMVLADGGSIGNWGRIAGGTGGAGSASQPAGVVGTGIVLSAGGMVTNGSADGSSALITGGIGIQALGTAGATVTNFGTIASSNGTSGTAIGFGGSGGNLLVLEHGYSFVGTVTVAGPANTLELAGDAGAINVDFDKSGAGFTNFGIVEFGPASGNDEILTISDTTALPGTISGFTQTHDIVDLTRLNPVGASAVLNDSEQLVISNGGQTVTLQLDTSQDYTGIVWQTSPDAGNGTDVAPVCFCRGTLILTARGEIAVEDLAVGDRVKSLSGSWKPIVWIGSGRSLVTRTNKLARPIIVRACALADNVPRRDLYLTHGHALFFDGVLIPVENLVNHRSIAWDDTARVVEYYHIELADHDVVFAEGAPAETYYNASNRAFFQNTRAGSEAGAEKPTCVPVLDGGEIVETVWAELFKRAGGHLALNTTDEPDIHLLVDGERLEPTATNDGVYSFALEHPPAAHVLLCSRRGVPSLLGIGRSDHRPLGVVIRRIVLWHAGIPTSFDYDAPQLREGGCHPTENGYCWTDGEFELPARFFTLLNGACTLVVHTEQAVALVVGSERHRMRYSIRAASAEPDRAPAAAGRPGLRRDAARSGMTAQILSDENLAPPYAGEDLARGSP